MGILRAMGIGACGLVVAVAMAASGPAALAAPPAAAAIKNPSPLGAELRQLLRAARAVAGRGDPAAAAVAIEAVASHADFPRMRAADRSALLLQGTELAIESGDHARAARLARASVDAGPDVALAWYLLAQLEAVAERDGPAALAFAHVARTWPELVEELPWQIVLRVEHRLGLDSTANRAMLEALHAAGWTIEGVVPVQAWAKLALMRLADGDAAGARAALAAAASPDMAVWTRIDRRFDALVDHEDPRFDPLAAAAAWIAGLRRTVEAHPASLGARHELGSALLRVGRDAEVLALVEDAVADPSRFDDADELPWMFNQRAIALRRLGRTDDALAAQMVAAATPDASGRPDVSQALNLGTLLVDLQRPEDALSAVARAEDMSRHGVAVQSTVRLRAYRQLGLPADAEVWFERLRADREEAPLLWLQALLGADRDDEAADWLAGLLADPDRRAEALDWCQHHLAPAPLPGRAPLVEARSRLLARADVRAAVDAVGRCGPSGLYRPFGID